METRKKKTEIRMTFRMGKTRACLEAKRKSVGREGETEDASRGVLEEGWPRAQVARQAWVREREASSSETGGRK